MNNWVANLKSFFTDLFYSVSFKHRIRISFIILITLAISAVGTTSYLIAANEIQSNAFESSRETVSKTAQIVDDRLRNVEASVRSLMLSEAFREITKDVQRNSITEYFQNLTALQPAFSQVKSFDPLIHSILIVTPIGDFYPTTENRIQGYSFYDTEMFDRMKADNNGFWVRAHSDPFFTGSERVLSFVVRGVYGGDISIGQTNMYVVVNMKEKELIRLITQNSPKKDRNYFLIDSAGEDIIQTRWATEHHLQEDFEFLDKVADEHQGDFFHPFDNDNYLVNYSRLDTVDDWLLFGTLSKDQLLQQVNGIQRTTIYIILGFVLTSWLISNRLTVLLLRPLFKLRGLMRRVEDNQLSVRFESKYKDEVAQVGFQFNGMLDEINRLIADVKYSEQGKREAQLKALTAQMEPHFLYNTLNTIYCKSVLGENNDVNEMILALSEMFQLGLSGGRDLISLEDELSHVKQYCAIQQKCYEDLFEYHIDVEDELLLACYVPKIIIQPLVENSILHGFKNSGSKGIIRIQVKDDHRKLHLIIEDNGSGMDVEKVRAGMEFPNNSNKGYALRNITNRLQLYYGDKASMGLFNNDDNGSRIELWIPKTRGDQD
jgi:two-component system sensor histidine kinase YesM